MTILLRSLLAAAAAVAVAGVLGGTGSAHELTGTFSVFGHHVTGSTGMPLLRGVVVGAVAVLGLASPLVGARDAAAAADGYRDEFARQREALPRSPTAPGSRPPAAGRGGRVAAGRPALVGPGAAPPRHGARAVGGVGSVRASRGGPRGRSAAVAVRTGRSGAVVRSRVRLPGREADRREVVPEPVEQTASAGAGPVPDA